MKNINKILVPTDFSDFSLVGMEYAISLAVLYDADVYLLNVVDHDPVLAFHTVDLNSETVLRDREKKAMAMLKDLIANKFRIMQNIVPVVRRGDPPKEIVRYAREEGADLIVMATHGRIGLAHVFLGSVAEKVVRRSPVPVFTVKPKIVAEILLNDEDIREQLHVRT